MSDVMDCPKANAKNLVSKAAAARDAGVSRRIVEHAMAAGQLDTVQAGKRTWITRRSADAFRDRIAGTG